MRKASVVAVLLLFALALFLAMSPTAGASASGGATFPLDHYVNLSNNLTVHVIQLTVSNVTYGGAFSPDPENTSWPVISFQYLNNANYQGACRFEVKLADDTGTAPDGWTYDKVDDTISQPLYPGHVTQTVTLEFAMPDNRTLTELQIIDPWTKAVIARYPVVYPTLTPAPAATTAETASPGGSDNLRDLMLIPIILGLVGLAGWLLARRRLF